MILLFSVVLRKLRKPKQMRGGKEWQKDIVDRFRKITLVRIKMKFHVCSVILLAVAYNLKFIKRNPVIGSVFLDVWTFHK